MNFLVDEQLPPGLVYWLREQGFSAEHVNEISLADGEDTTIWNHALAIDAIIVTKDEDFAERASRTISGPIVIWLRIGNSTNRSLFKWLEPRWPSICQLLSDGHRLIEVR